VQRAFDEGSSRSHLGASDIPIGMNSTAIMLPTGTMDATF
jgi:hypothetical protein